jgi:hypothetical protein
LLLRWILRSQGPEIQDGSIDLILNLRVPYRPASRVIG